MHPYVYFAFFAIFCLILAYTTVSRRRSGMPPRRDPPQNRTGELLRICRHPTHGFNPMNRNISVAIHTPEQAWKIISTLYPEHLHRIDGWCELNNHFLFSLASDDTSHRPYIRFLHIEHGSKTIRFGETASTQ